MEKMKCSGVCILRYFLGLVFVLAGVNKLFMLEGLAAGFTGWFGEVGMFLMWIVIAAEVLGGLALLLDWHAMEASAVLGIVMIVAFAKTFALRGDTSGFLDGAQQVLTAMQTLLLVGLVTVGMQGCKRCQKKE